MGLWGEEPAARAVYGGGDSPLHENPSPPPRHVLGASSTAVVLLSTSEFYFPFLLFTPSWLFPYHFEISLFDIFCRPNAHSGLSTATQSLEQNERLTLSLSPSNIPINLAFDSDSSLVPSFKVADVQVSAITFIRPLLGTAFMIFCGTTTRPP
jgi:hypothetical protein